MKVISMIYHHLRPKLIESYLCEELQETQSKHPIAFDAREWAEAQTKAEEKEELSEYFKLNCSEWADQILFES
jgi:hypothetical protein